MSSEVEVVTIGRLGTDTIYPLQTGVGLEDVETFGRFLGASPTNVAVAAARLGHTAAALTGVGDDSFGRFVRREMVRLGVPDAFAITSPDFATLVTFCEIFQPDNFPLYFDPQPSAPDMQLSVTDMPLDVIRAAKLCWITVTGLSEEPSRSGHHAALGARDRAPYAVLDLDCRPMFWSSAHEATEQVRKCLGQFTVAVGNREECEVAVGETGSPAGSPMRYSRPASRWPSSSRAPKQRWPRPGTCGSWWPPSRSTSSTGWALVTPPAGPSAIACSMAGHSNASSPGPAQQGDRCLPARVFDGNAHGRRGRGCPGRHARRRSQPRAAQGAEQMTTIDELGGIRAFEPECIAQVLRDRPRGVMPHLDSKLMIIAADHPARSALAAGADPLAMAGRSELLARCVEALSRPCVHGFLGTADMVEDLALLGALDGKAVYGSMNRGSLAGAGFEMGARFTGYDALGVIPAGWTAHPPWVLDFTPEQAGWRFSGSTIIELAAGGSQELATGEDEALALPLRGSCSVEAEGTTYVPAGRPDVFTAVTGHLCLRRETTAGHHAGRRRRLRHPDGASHPPPGGLLPPRQRSPGGAARRRELLTSGPTTTPGQCPRHRHLLVSEVLTPGGNWSSYPQHKHDVHSEVERELEEIYYFDVRPGPGGPGFAFHRTYGTAEHPIEISEVVHAGDVVLTPHGFHGPSMAAPGYDLHHLDVTVGPAADGIWLMTDDRTHHWIRDAWETQDVDRRLSMTRPVSTHPTTPKDAQ